VAFSHCFQENNYKIIAGCTLNDLEEFQSEIVRSNTECSINCATNPICVSANVIPEGDRLKCEYFDHFAEDLDNLECGQDGHRHMCEFV